MPSRRPDWGAPDIPPPECPLGYPDWQVDAILGDRADEFHRWMAGQTVMLCNGQRYNYATKAYEPDQCADCPHGMVTYQSDLTQFLAGGRPLD